jgi:hypothetical protein
MKNFRTRSMELTFATLVCLCFGAQSWAQSSSHAPLSRILETGSQDERSTAIATILATPLEARTGDVLPALLQELDRQKIRLAARVEARKSGRSLPSNHSEGEVLLDALAVVAQYPEDERILPYMLTFIASGDPMMRILASRGERSAASVLTLARSDTAPIEDVESALITLKWMLEGKPKAPISDSIKAQISAVATARLSGIQSPTVVMEAAGLAIATKDPVLRERVRELSADSSHARAMGVRAEVAEMVRKRASAALERETGAN